MISCRMPVLNLSKAFTFLVLYLATAFCAIAQISEYTDCSEYYHDGSDFEQTLTQEEKAERLENAFYGRLSDIVKCVNGESAEEGRSSGGASGGEAGQSISNNILTKGEKSFGITGTKTQGPIVDEAVSYESSVPNGREHLELEEVDNKAALRVQIKAQADIETDPDIKEKLMEQYEALK